MLASVWLPLSVLGMPFVAFVLLAVVTPLRRSGPRAGLVSIGAMAIALGGALTVWAKGFVGETTWVWIPADGGPIATVGLLVDPLSTAMLVLVTLVSLLVQIYSLAYLQPQVMLNDIRTLHLERRSGFAGAGTAARRAQ